MMKYRKAIISMLFMTVLMIGCSKKELQEKESNMKQIHSTQNARLNSEMTDEEYENDIIGFIHKLDNPSSQADMEYIEAFEYVEATLIYNYIDLDYSKCANTSIFTSSISISPDADGMMSMVDIKSAYDAMKTQWSSYFNSISDNDKTPIIFRITEITTTNVKYEMLIGYGYIDLSLYGENYAAPTGISYINAAQDMTYGMLQHLKDLGITNKPGPNYHLVYQTVPNSRVDIKDPTQHPSTNDPLPPTNNGYTDYLFFYTNSADTSYHLSLNSTEYNYYDNEFHNYVANYLQNISSNRIIYASLIPKSKTVNTGSSLALHELLFFHQIRRWVLNAPSTL